MTLHTQLADDLCSTGFHIIDNFLQPTSYHALREALETTYQQGSFKPAKIGQKQEKADNTAIRGDQIFWLDKPSSNHAINEFFTHIDMLCATLNHSLFLGLIDYEAHFAIYQPNNFYKKHIDQFSTKKDRRISCVYYLNDDWQPAFGGELNLYDPQDQLLSSIMPIANRFVCFNSDLPHEVCTAYQTRYSIATWLKIRPLMP